MNNLQALIAIAEIRMLRPLEKSLPGMGHEPGYEDGHEPPYTGEARCEIEIDSERSIEKALRTITVQAAIRHLAGGKLAPIHAHVRQVTEAEYDQHVEVAIKKGVEAIAAVLRRTPPAIPDAFHHPRLGPIGLDFEGARHIVDQRKKQYPGDNSEETTAKVLLDVARAAILGRPQEDLGPVTDKSSSQPQRLPSRIAIVYHEHEVIVEPRWRTKYPNLAKGQTSWVVSGYRIDPQRKKDREAEKDSLGLRFQTTPTAGRGIIK